MLMRLKITNVCLVRIGVLEQQEARQHKYEHYDARDRSQDVGSNHQVFSMVCTSSAFTSDLFLRPFTTCLIVDRQLYRKKKIV